VQARPRLQSATECAPPLAGAAPPQVPSWGLSLGAPALPCPTPPASPRARRGGSGGAGSGAGGGEEITAATAEGSEAEPEGEGASDEAPGAAAAAAAEGAFRMRWCVVAPRVTAPAPGQPAGLVRAALWAYDDWDCSQPRMQVTARRRGKGSAEGESAGLALTALRGRARAASPAARPAALSAARARARPARRRGPVRSQPCRAPALCGPRPLPLGLAGRRVGGALPGVAPRGVGRHSGERPRRVACSPGTPHADASGDGDCCLRRCRLLLP
jgi:hypothetical protein